MGRDLLDDFRATQGVGFDRDFFCRRTALEIVDALEARRIKLLGIEGFYLSKQGTEPDMDWILDMSDCPFSYQIADRFLRDSSPLPLFFCFTIEESDQQSSMEERP